MKVAIHSVFIAKENILFLEQWIDYHINIGFDAFYLYDNSKVKKSNLGRHHWHKCFVPGKVNKYNVEYDTIVPLDDEQVQTMLQKIRKKYDCVSLIEWSPTDNKGIVLHEQVKAQNDGLHIMKNEGVDWCAFIDMDEFIVLQKHENIQEYLKSQNCKMSCIYMSQIRYDSRFNNIGKLVINITQTEIKGVAKTFSMKYICKLNETTIIDIHKWKGNGMKMIAPKAEILFNHYKLNKEEYKTLDNISPKIREITIKNAEKYIAI